MYTSRQHTENPSNFPNKRNKMILCIMYILLIRAKIIDYILFLWKIILISHFIYLFIFQNKF